MSAQDTKTPEQFIPAIRIEQVRTPAGFCNALLRIAIPGRIRRP
jgi:hypothetical protein